MTLRLKSAIISLLILLVVVFSLKLFNDYNTMNNSILRNMLAADKILNSNARIYKALTGTELNTETAKKIAEGIPDIMRPITTGELAQDELNSLISVKMAFIRIERLLKGLTPGEIIPQPKLRQINNELLKIEESAMKFEESFRKRMEKEKGLMMKIQAALFSIFIFGIIFLFLSFYRSFLRPILRMTSEVADVKGGKIENISIYKSKDEIGRLSDFTYKTLDELRKSTEALSQRYETQYATSEILKAAQKVEDIDSFLKEVLETILSIKWLSVMDKGAIFIVDDSNPEVLALRAEKNFADYIKEACKDVPLGKCLCGRAAQNGRVIYKRSLDKEHEITYEGMTPHGHYCVPIKHEDKVLGVITLYLEENYVAQKMDLDFLESISIIIADSLVMKKLVEKEHFITRAIEETGESVMIANRGGIVEYVNPAFEEITGYHKDEIKGKNLFTQIYPDEITDSALKMIDRDKNMWSGTVKNKKKDGREYYEYLSVIPIVDARGEVIRFVSIGKDITKERVLEDQLMQAQRMEVIGRLAGGIAHDFNNYMSAVLGHGELALDKLGEDDPARKNIEIMISAANMAAILTKQLLAFSRKQAISPVVLNPNKSIEDMGKMLGRLIGENIELEIITSPELRNIKIDTGQFEQIIMNIVLNAKDAMPGGGKLKIETANVTFDEDYSKAHLDAPPGEYVMISFSDTGVGMTGEIRGHIFEPFFTTKEKGKGTGLGLSTVYGIVKQNDGHIFVYSEPGMGTTFKVYLPRARADVEKKEEITDERPRGTETILIVEDQDTVRQLAAETLSGLGYTVLEAKEGLDALELCTRYHGKIALLLTDVVMPKMGGPELAEKIRVRQSEIKVIYMSGYTENAIGHEGVLDKGINFISKPFTISKLAKLVRGVLDK
ncbi:MAG: multi-sensor hybrid histidine kinase [Nitrospirae bacterium]|nr:MAG: multi-sensor hybrid histidine kinase [Nitrospirota bacterium]